MLLVAPQDLATPAARADFPEMGHCVADAELVVGSTGGSVVCVQWTLLWMGQYTGLVTGTYDQATFQAVIKFQQAHPPLTPNGTAGSHTLTEMGIYSGIDKPPPPTCLADAPVNLGDRGPSAECVQKVLQSKFLFAGTIDGAQQGLAAVRTTSSIRRSSASSVADNDTAALGIWVARHQPGQRQLTAAHGGSRRR